MAHGLSQSSLAEELGISQSAVSEIETGKSTLYLRRLLELARATGIHFSATWEEEVAPQR